MTFKAKDFDVAIEAKETAKAQMKDFNKMLQERNRGDNELAKRTNLFWKDSTDTKWVIAYGNKEDSYSFQAQYISAITAQKSFDILQKQGCTIGGVFEITTTTKVKRVDV